MYQHFDSPTGVRFLAFVKEGKSFRESVRLAGIGKETGYRWLRDEYLQYRSEGLDHVAAQKELGFISRNAEKWNERFLSGTGRHHFQVDPAVEETFWSSYSTGMSVLSAAASAGVKHTTGYRWVYRRFITLRSRLPLTEVVRALRLSPGTSVRWEIQRKEELKAEKARQQKAERDAIGTARIVAERVAAPWSPAQKRRALRETRYWDLVSAGCSNAEACRMLGMSRRAGTKLRNQRAEQSHKRVPAQGSGRYLSLLERIQIADLLRLDCSLRRIGRELGRCPSTIKRELDRHRDGRGQYSPHAADHSASQQRRRPRDRKLKRNRRLRAIVQRKLNRHWSPEQICGWLALQFPVEPGLQLSPETIYRALLFNDDGGLDKKYCPRLRTGRKIRRHRWRTGSGHGAVVRNMTMISQRPPVIETKTEAGHWEGDLIVGPGSTSAMVTLRERKTHYGIIINLPIDHTAARTNVAITAAFASLPPHLKQTLTWDQGVEMARHHELAAATGIQIYFAERSSPWQRGANENFNGLARQYFRKGTDLSKYTHEYVKSVCNELNTRPRKTLGYLTPKALFQAEKSTTLATSGYTRKQSADRPDSPERCVDP
ncbi:IS30 family transposase [Arthrobacter sp. efr-133-TYG-104]|uniref:IS30 family transposase n=1 Tax=Arthrobacter sp. efr-133-TYG-104 TaxID=3040324 RepID=UPI00255193E7|nr:IS30 family transposase [Arthrobacter sp. efr-133-TYG-104]